MTARFKRPDHKNAQSIIQAAKKDMKFTLSLPVTEEAGATIIRNIYECFRMLGDALVTKQGIDSWDHKIPLETLMNLSVTARRPVRVLENLRQLRHNINYYGYTPRMSDITDSIDIAKVLFQPLLEEVRKII